VRLFAQLAQKPRDFLLQVEEAVGPAGQAELHRWLIAQNSERQIAEKNKEQLQQDLDRYKEKQKSLDIEMQRYQNLLDIQRQLDCAQDFRPHLLANTEQQRYDEKAQQIEPLRQEVAEKERSLHGAREVIAQKRNEVNRAEKAVEDSGKSMRKLREDVAKKCSDAESAVKAAERAAIDLSGAQQDVNRQHHVREQHAQEVQRAMDAINSTRNRLDDIKRLGQFDSMEREKKSLNADFRRSETEMNDAATSK
jgi:chromosome segregation ATPase